MYLKLLKCTYDSTGTKIKVIRKEVVRHHVSVVLLKEVQLTVSRWAVWLCVQFAIVYSDRR